MLRYVKRILRDGSGGGMKKTLTIAAWLCAALAGVAQAAVQIPPGNRHVEQPAVPGGSAARTKALKTTYEAKYRKVLSL